MWMLALGQAADEKHDSFNVVRTVDRSDTARRNTDEL
jgi:hypothetical protein